MICRRRPINSSVGSAIGVVLSRHKKGRNEFRPSFHRDIDSVLVDVEEAFPHVEVNAFDHHLAVTLSVPGVNAALKQLRIEDRRLSALWRLGFLQPTI